ncbi:MAG: hypothetical protein AB7L90_04385 [Hyphomicrobiaceae bacterium]
MDQLDRHKHSDAHPADLTTTESRQASGRSTNLRVLVIGTLMVILAGLAVGGYFYVPADNRPPVEAAPPRT